MCACVGMFVFHQNQLPNSFFCVHKRRHGFDGKQISHNNSAIQESVLDLLAFPNTVPVTGV
jgi:hypothetical protein